MGQFFAWGILYYAFAMVAGPLHDDTGWSQEFVNGGLSLGLLVWGICALPAGAWIQRRGARLLMPAGAFLGGVSLILMATCTASWGYLISWILLGCAMAGMLYEPAFAVVTTAFGQEYRRGIILITLLGGLASTAFLPLTHALVDAYGWRSALISLGLLQVLVAVPLHLGLPGSISNPSSLEALPPWYRRFIHWAGELRHYATDRRFIGLSLWFTAHTAAFSALTFLFAPIHQRLGADTEHVLWAMATFGPMQVLGRLALAFWGRDFRAVSVGGWALGALILSMVLLLIWPAHMISMLGFAVLYGAANGITTILKGTSVAELFGTERYAELNGLLSGPLILGKAASPLVLASMWSRTGMPEAVLVAILGLFVIAALGWLLVVKASREVR